MCAISGETFSDIRTLKKVLKDQHRQDFYRCLTDKLMTYALGRGMEWYDTESIDQIVEKLDHNDGHFSVLLSGIIDSAPFQRRRVTTAAANDNDAAGKPGPRAELKD